MAPGSEPSFLRKTRSLIQGAIWPLFFKFSLSDAFLLKHDGGQSLL